MGKRKGRGCESHPASGLRAWKHIWRRLARRRIARHGEDFAVRSFRKLASLYDWY